MKVHKGFWRLLITTVFGAKQMWVIHSPEYRLTPYFSKLDWDKLNKVPCLGAQQWVIQAPLELATLWLLACDHWNMCSMQMYLWKSKYKYRNIKKSEKKQTRILDRV